MPGGGVFRPFISHIHVHIHVPITITITISIHRYFSHTIKKVNRVSFGLLQKKDMENFTNIQPLSRQLLGIPFVGKVSLRLRIYFS